MNQLEYIEAILDVVQRADMHDAITWRGQGTNRRAYALCSDWFVLACADGEEIAPEHVPLFQQCLEDLEAIERENPEDHEDQVATAWLGELYATRRRQIPPARSVYEQVGPALQKLLPTP